MHAIILYESTSPKDPFLCKHFYAHQMLRICCYFYSVDPIWLQEAVKPLQRKENELSWVSSSFYSSQNHRWWFGLGRCSDSIIVTKTMREFCQEQFFKVVWTVTKQMASVEAFGVLYLLTVQGTTALILASYSSLLHRSGNTPLLVYAAKSRIAPLFVVRSSAAAVSKGETKRLRFPHNCIPTTVEIQEQPPVVTWLNDS